ncbi:MAG: Fpg/Nei family DNA glycosylase [Vulcanimicrobiaceae bacterium]
MPEGPQVARYARLQSETLCGRAVRADSPNGRSDDVAALVDRATLRGIEAIGKHLLYDFGEDRLLHVHLGRFGNFHQGTMPLPEVRGVLRFRLYTETDWFELRGAIAIEIYDAAMRGLLERRIGPNPLDPAANAKRAYEKIVASRTAIGLQMMDQSIVAGIGNIYRSEVLFLNGVDPRDPGPTLARGTWRAIWKDLARLMAHGAEVGRIVTTWPKDRAKPTGPVRRDDRFYVYHRTGLPCRRCGTLVCENELGKRRAFWCPRCQPASTAEAAATPTARAKATRKPAPEPAARAATQRSAEARRPAR